ncbi:hypothetical protein AB6C40_14975 [Vibrio splendidus]
MNLKTRLTTMTILIFLSVLGGLLGNSIGPDVGFTIGITGTYLLLVAGLVANGKVKFKGKG